MSGSKADAGWLQLRAPYDGAASDGREAGALASAFGAALRRRRERGPLRLLDLGGGTGANVCRLAPRLFGSQTWRVVDSDAVLLAQVEDTVVAWARRIGGKTKSVPGGVSVTTPQRIVTVTGLAYDLCDGLTGLPLAQTDGVTGAALLDRASAASLNAAVTSLADHQVSALFTLNVNGDIRWRPGQADDADVARAFLRDLGRGKGFVTALGQRAAAMAFEARGYAVRTTRADWRLRGGDAEMHRALLSLIALGARGQPPTSADPGDWERRIEAWVSAKLAEIRAGSLELTIGHTDMLAIM